MLLLLLLLILFLLLGTKPVDSSPTEQDNAGVDQPLLLYAREGLDEHWECRGGSREGLEELGNPRIAQFLEEQAHLFSNLFDGRGNPAILIDQSCFFGLQREEKQLIRGWIIRSLLLVFIGLLLVYLRYINRFGSTDDASKRCPFFRVYTNSIYQGSCPPLLDEDVITMIWFAGSLVVAGGFFSTVYSAGAFGDKVGVIARNDLLAKTATKKEYPRVAMGALMAAVVGAKDKEPSFKQLYTGGVFTFIFTMLGMYCVYLSRAVQTQPNVYLAPIARMFMAFVSSDPSLEAQKKFYAVVAALSLLGSVLGTCILVPAFRSREQGLSRRHEQIGAKLGELYARAQTKIRFLELDGETLSKQVPNAVDPDVHTLAQYMAVNDKSHPKTRAMILSTREVVQVLVDGPLWYFEKTTQYTVRLDSTEEELQVPGNDLAMVQALLLGAIDEQFSQEWDPERHPPIDFFVTHSWTDDANENAGKKYRAMLELNEAFKQRFGRPARVWYEKLCIPQGTKLDMSNCELLPVFIACSSTLLCMHSQSWQERLWCLSEAGDHAMMGNDKQPTPILLCDLDGSFSGSAFGGGESKRCCVDVAAARCGHPEDEQNLRRAISQMPSPSTPLRQTWMFIALSIPYSLTVFPIFFIVAFVMGLYLLVAEVQRRLCTLICPKATSTGLMMPVASVGRLFRGESADLRRLVSCLFFESSLGYSRGFGFAECVVAEVLQNPQNGWWPSSPTG
jgi:hypothetical protein